MKKAWILCCMLLWMFVCSVHIYSRNQSLEYEIHYDSHTKQTYEIKEKMQKTFDDLVSNVHTDSQGLMVLHNIEKFSYPNIKAEWKDKLVLIEGDGKGSIIEGDLKTRQYCMDKVQPRSFIQELFAR